MKVYVIGQVVIGLEQRVTHFLRQMGDSEMANKTYDTEDWKLGCFLEWQPKNHTEV